MHPNLFIIGAPKCGTTSLYDYLVGYPHIFGGTYKEPHYFCGDLPEIRKADSLDRYLSFFDKLPPRSDYVVDASTNYIYSQHAVAQILEFNPDAKIIVMLRDPIDLVRSLHDHLVFQQIETNTDLNSAWDSGPIGQRVPEFAKSRPYPGYLSYQAAGMLGERLQHVYETVPESKRLTLFFDDLIRDQRRLAAVTMDFLNVPLIDSIEFRSSNRAKQMRWPWLNRALMYPPKPLRLMKNGVKRLGPASAIRKLDLFDRISQAPRAKRRIESDLEARMRSYYADDITLLSKLTGRDLDHWRSPSKIGSRIESAPTATVGH